LRRPLNDLATLIEPFEPGPAPATNVIANGNFSEEPQKLSLNLHGDHAWLLGGWAVKPRLQQFRFSTDN
jgi:hypothetical protein